MITPLFDDWIDGTGAAQYSGALWTRFVGAADAVVLQAVLPIGPISDINLSVYLDHSTDGRNWASKYTSSGTDVALLSAALKVGGVQSFTAGEVTPVPPTLKHGRLRIVYTGPALRIKVFQINRIANVRARSGKAACCSACAHLPAPRPPEVSRETGRMLKRVARVGPSRELAAHLAAHQHRSVKSLPSAMQWQFARTLASPALRAEMDGLAERATTLPAAVRGSVVDASASGYLQLLAGAEALSS